MYMNYKLITAIYRVGYFVGKTSAYLTIAVKLYNKIPAKLRG